MKVYLWIFNVYSEDDYFWRIVLHDGEFTYWHEDMKGSGGYNKTRLCNQVCMTTNSKYVYIGEL